MLIPQLKAQGMVTLAPSFLPRLLFSWLLVNSSFTGPAWVKTQPWPVMSRWQGAEGVLSIRDTVCWSPCCTLSMLSYCTSHSKPMLTQFLSNSAKNTPAFCSQWRMRSALPQSGRLSACFYWQFKDLSSFNIKCHSLFKVYFCVFIFPFTIVNLSSLFLKPMNNLHVITLYLRNGEII